MTAFDIYSALGNVSEELLEESELPAVKKMPKGFVYMTAAAACFAVLAVGLRFAFNDSGIAAPEQGELVTVGDSRAAADGVTQYTSPLTAETTRSVTTWGLETDIIGLETDGEANADFTSKCEVEETTVCPTETTANLTLTATMTTEQTQDEEETAIVPKWEDMSDFERYTLLQYNGNEYSITMNKFDESELTFLQNGVLYGFEESYCEPCDSEEDMKHYSATCAFYKIKNVNENYMIAVPTADGNYTAFINFQYRPDSLGSYIKDIDFSNRYKLTTIHSQTHDLVDGEVDSHYFKYDLPDLQQAVEKLFAENSEAVPKTTSRTVTDRYLIICGNDTFPTVRISDGGYICVFDKYFWIGEEKTESFMKYIEENAVKTEYDPRAGADANETDIPE